MSTAFPNKERESVNQKRKDRPTAVAAILGGKTQIRPQPSSTLDLSPSTAFSSSITSSPPTLIGANATSDTSSSSVLVSNQLGTTSIVQQSAQHHHHHLATSTGTTSISSTIATPAHQFFAAQQMQQQQMPISSSNSSSSSMQQQPMIASAGAGSYLISPQMLPAGHFLLPGGSFNGSQTLLAVGPQGPVGIVTPSFRHLHAQQILFGHQQQLNAANRPPPPMRNSPPPTLMSSNCVGSSRLSSGNGGSSPFIRPSSSSSNQQQQQQQQYLSAAAAAFQQSQLQPNHHQQQRSLPPLLPAPGPLHDSHHTNHHHHHVPIAPAPQAPKWQIVQQPGGNFVMQQVGGGGNVLGFSLPSNFMFQSSSVQNQQQIVTNNQQQLPPPILSAATDLSNGHHTALVQHTKDSEPIDQPPPLILGGTNDDDDSEMSLHELFLAEVRKHAPSKPDIISHIIDGFIIQESLDPFPFDSYGCIESLVPSEAISSLWCGSNNNVKCSPPTPSPPMKRPKIQCSLCLALKQTAFDDDEIDQEYCLYCHKSLTHGNRYDKAPQYCSRKCKRKQRHSRGSLQSSPTPMNTTNDVQSSVDNGSANNNNSRNTTMSSVSSGSPTTVVTSPTVKIKPLIEPSSSSTVTSPSTVAGHMAIIAGGQLDRNPRHWTEAEVQLWVTSVIGSQCVEVFVTEQIDGAALMLLQDEHLVRTLQLKLGPAVKLQNALNELKSRFPD